MMGSTPPKKPGLGGLAAKLLGKQDPGKRQTARVVVGLDYGTSATKVVVAIAKGTERSERQALPLFGDPVTPSVVALHRNGELEFGLPAARAHELDRRGVRVLRSLKMRLREAVLDGEPDRAPAGVDAPIAALVWGYLVRVVQEVEAQLAVLLPPAQWDVHTVWQLGVPMIRHRQPALEDTFRKLLYRAVHRPRGLTLPQQLPLSELTAHYIAARRVSCPPASRSDCLAFAEAAVALSAIQLQRGRLEPGHYFVCDVGAGTTDLAFFWFSPKADTPINFYSTECVPCGGDRFFAAVLSGLTHLQGEVAFSEARARLHVPSSSRRDLAPFASVLKELHAARTRAFRVALRYEEVARWGRVTGFLVGGGSAMPGVRERVANSLETFVPDEDVSVYLRKLDLHHAVSNATELHWIAMGLSMRAQEMEIYSPPEQTPPVSQTGRILRPIEERDDSAIK